MQLTTASPRVGDGLTTRTGTAMEGFSSIFVNDKQPCLTNKNFKYLYITGSNGQYQICRSNIYLKLSLSLQGPIDHGLEVIKPRIQPKT